MKAVAALLLVGMLILWAELKPVPPLAGSAWSCPPVRFTCGRPNPPNACGSDLDCPRGKKCCRTFCGTRCLSEPPDTPTS
uniref:WAP domain-containing protein n=1 Tax=Cyanoderma ruficeps TaxID=181631 RepID=A0A8C3R1K2_9PASS